jgi:UPF0755 protein
LVALLRELSSGSASYNYVTIPEGLIIEETASRLSQFCGIDSAELVALAHDARFVNGLGVGASSLEGYLFPDTYQFAWGTEPRVALEAMVQRFFTVFLRLDTNSIISGKYTRHQIVIIASIVQREIGVEKEAPRVAGVFLRRLKIGMSLGADPTVRYALRKFCEPLTVSDLKTPSPYNTRVYRGLPPGPICNPGYSALQGTLFPLETDDLYFVAKGDNSKEHHFTRTYSDHIRATAQARKEKQLRQGLIPNN